MFDDVITALRGTSLEAVAPTLLSLAKEQWGRRTHGDRRRWLDAVAALPPARVGRIELDTDAVTAVAEPPMSPEHREMLRQCLMALHPWRKGPFDLFGLTVDAEWRSDRKWRRVAPHLASLADRVVLDVGCGNGYYLYRMLGAGARAAIGVDPTQLFVAQFRAVNHYIGSRSAIVLPLRGEDLDQVVSGFDTVFSMGIYYHRRDPVAHLSELWGFLRPGGELVLETLVIGGGEDTALEPENRYARMRNVWVIPSVPRLVSQLQNTGFGHIRVVDVTPTTTTEQRRTDWMTFESLADCLDPEDPRKTVEGYPGPLRACIIATRIP